MQDDKAKNKQVEYSSSTSPNLWAYILIAFGAIWLLGNLGFSLGWLWPLILIGLGALLLTGNLHATNVESHHFETALENSTAANMKLVMSVGEGTVKALAEGNQLISADLRHRGEVEFLVSGQQEKTIVLRPTHQATWLWLNPANWFNMQHDLKWNIGLTARIPLDLTLESGVGKNQFDLTGVQLKRLQVNTGVGSVDVRLPSTDSAYDALVQGGVGETHVDIAEGAAINLKINGGVGAVKIHPPHDAAVRVKATIGVGNVNLSSRFAQMSGSSHMVGKSGVWETPNFAEAQRQITINFDGGVGELRVW